MVGGVGHYHYGGGVGLVRRRVEVSSGGGGREMRGENGLERKMVGGK